MSLNLIHTCLNNFQDVLLRKNQHMVHYGVMKECIELQKTPRYPVHQSSRTYYCLGGFHAEKVLLACTGKCLEGVGVEEEFVEKDI